MKLHLCKGVWQGGRIRIFQFTVMLRRRPRTRCCLQTFLEGLIEGFDYLDFRSDTHAENEAMQHMAFEKLGFQQVAVFQLMGNVYLSEIKNEAE